MRRYPAFAISGAVDLIGLWIPLPQGMAHGFLSMGFLVETLLMALHKKHDPFDQVGVLCLTGFDRV